MLKLDSKNTYVWGCCHRSHRMILEYSKRPFKTIEEMNSALESAVLNLPNGSTLVDLGDFSFGGRNIIEENWYKYFYALSEKDIKCYFIFGNHDKHIRKLVSAIPGWSSKCVTFTDILEFVLDGVADFIVASHYPMEDWHGRAAHHTNYETPTGGSYHIHCHTHRELESSKGIRRIHGGVDTIGFQPILIRELINRIDYNLITDIINKDKY